MSLFENLNSIYSIKNDIKSALENKGVDMTNYSFPDYPSVINDLSTGGNMSTLSVSVNGTYYPEAGYDGFSEVSVNVFPNLGYDYVFSSNGFYNPEDYGYDGFAKIGVSVPQSVTGFTEKEVTEGVQIVNLSNSASYVHPYVFEKDTYLQTVYLPNCTSVGEQAFALCTNLTSVYMPNCVNLGSAAFSGCTKLENINIENIKELKGSVLTSTKISSISLPNCILLSGNVFELCMQLSDIYLPNCVTIQGSTFSRCMQLSSISLPNCKIMSAGVFSGCVALNSVYAPNCIKLSGQTPLFSGCSSLTRGDFPNCIYIGNSTFMYTSFSEISLPKLRYLGGITFQYCRSLSELNLPACGYVSGAVINDTDVTKVNIPMAISFRDWYGNAAFANSQMRELYLNIDVYGCPSYSLVIGSNTSIGKGIGSVYVNEQNYSYFISANGWSSISSIIFSVSADSYPLISGSDGLLYGSTKAVESNYKNYTSLSSENLLNVSLPNCEYVEDLAFNNCRSLTSVSLPNCEYIGYSAFSGCSNITDISIPNCKYIGNNAFSGCSNIQSLTFNECKYIGPTAFYNCNQLSSIYFLGSDVCFIEQNTMTQIYAPNGYPKFYVPSSMVDKYKTALYWSQYSSRIFPISE